MTLGGEILFEWMKKFSGNIYINYYGFVFFFFFFVASEVLLW